MFVRSKATQKGKAIINRISDRRKSINHPKDDSASAKKLYLGMMIKKLIRGVAYIFKADLMLWAVLLSLSAVVYVIQQIF